MREDKQTNEPTKNVSKGVAAVTKISLPLSNMKNKKIILTIFEVIFVWPNFEIPKFIFE